MEKTALAEVDAGSGRFERTPSVYRSAIRPEHGRYILYVSLACPWANRCLAVLYLKGLQDHVRVSVVHPVWQRTRPDSDTDMHCGWVFKKETDPPISNAEGYGRFDCKGCIPDPLGRAQSVRDLYDEAKDTKFTVPVLYDSKTCTIVNNESSDIIRMLNAWEGSHPLDLYPEDDRVEIDRMSEFIYESINNGVYKCGFATSQQAYDEAVVALYEALDACERILSTQRWLANTEEISEADIKLFCTLIRFDAVYVVYFKCNTRMIRDYPHLRRYVLDIRASYPAVARSVNMEHIKNHYFCSHPKLNPYAIVPRGPDAWWTQVESPSTRSLMGRRK